MYSPLSYVWNLDKEEKKLKSEIVEEKEVKRRDIVKKRG